MTDWFTQHAAPVLADLSENHADDLTMLAELKIAEWRGLIDTIAATAIQPAGAGR